MRKCLKSKVLRRCLIVGGVIVLFGVPACNPNIEADPNVESGNDGERSHAQHLPLGEPLNDNLNLNESDMTDWRYFQIPAPGVVAITLGCDYTGAHCTANLRDDVGRVMATIATEGEPRVTNEVDVGRGNYFLEVFVRASSSDYTVQVDYRAD